MNSIPKQVQSLIISLFIIGCAHIQKTQTSSTHSIQPRYCNSLTEHWINGLNKLENLDTTGARAEFMNAFSQAPNNTELMHQIQSLDDIENNQKQVHMKTLAAQKKKLLQGAACQNESTTENNTLTNPNNDQHLFSILNSQAPGQANTQLNNFNYALLRERGLTDTQKKDLEKLMSRLQSQISLCYIEALQTLPSTQGKITIDLEINQKGQIKRVNTTESNVFNPQLERCVLGLFKQLDFSKIEAAHATALSYPISFSQESR